VFEKIPQQTTSRFILQNTEVCFRIFCFGKKLVLQVLLDVSSLLFPLHDGAFVPRFVFYFASQARKTLETDLKHTEERNVLRVFITTAFILFETGDLKSENMSKIFVRASLK